MKFTKATLMILGLVTLSHSAMAIDSEPTAVTDRDAINTACANDGKLAGCHKSFVGKKLVSCIKGYQKNHPKFSISEDCSTALGQMHDDKVKAQN
jgi:hypothetical protein